MQVEEIKEIFEREHSWHLQYEGHCHDCGKEVTVTIDMEEDGRVIIAGGALYNPLILATAGRPQREVIFLKCNECFRKDDVLHNYQDTETYSRVVGFLRPISSWNPGKKEEWTLRKNYVI